MSIAGLQVTRCYSALGWLLAKDYGLESGYGTTSTDAVHRMRHQAVGELVVKKEVLVGVPPPFP